jgi:hypothetical protein
LRHEDLRKVLVSLAKNLDERAQHVADAARSQNTIPPYNRRFVVRLEELVKLRERLFQGRTGVISGHKEGMLAEIAGTLWLPAGPFWVSIFHIFAFRQSRQNHSSSFAMC